MSGLDLAGLTVAEAAPLIARRQLAAVELVQACLERIAETEPLLQAWVTLLEDRALQGAKRADAEIARGRYRGPLHGIPYGAKDIIWTRGIRTTAGSRRHADFTLRHDAAVIRRLRTAGAILLGKTTTTEFAYFEPLVRTRNPWSPDHTPGGSSMGSAVAVAARMAPFALGSQTGGSTLRPAAYCGVTGLKPAFGQINCDGLFPLSPSLDHVGVIAQTVRDAAMVADALTGRQRLAPLLEGGAAGIRLGLPDRFFQFRSSTGVMADFETAVQTCASLGAVRFRATLPPSLEGANAARDTISQAEAVAHYGEDVAAHSELYGRRFRAYVEGGRTLTAVAYLEALRFRERFIAELGALFKEIDVLVTPAAPATAPAGLEQTWDPEFLNAFSLAGFPSLAVPAGFDSEGLPVGIQMVAAPGHEQALLRLAHTYQVATGWHLRRPSPQVALAAQIAPRGI